MIRFYDTNALLRNIDEIEGVIYLSSITLQELENIKVSKNKDENTRFEARRVTRFLRDNEDRYKCIVVEKKHYEMLEDKMLPIDNDNLIIACAYELNADEEVEFITNDICCYNIAKHIFGLDCFSNDIVIDNNYKGYKEVIMTDEQLAKFYGLDKKLNVFDLLHNEYLILKDTLNQPIDAYRFNGDTLVELDVKPIKSNLLGKLKAKDFYQQIALDSFYNNKITVIKGKAGSGKSHLAMNFLFSQLERGKIDKIIIFTNPVPTRDSAEIGFLPGTREEKLMESNIGNFLLGKLGDKLQAIQLMSMGKLLLLPISDIRGFDTTNMNCALYITEAQNMSVDMMKLAIQRIGEDTVCVIDGDNNTQVDKKSFDGNNNGLRRLSEVFRGEEVYGEVELSKIYRSRISEIADKM